MKFSYKFSNLLGSIYRQGNLIFTPDGNSIISPVGNRLTIFDLKNNKSQTLSLESSYNYTTIALSPNGILLLAVNEYGEAQLISMVSCMVIQQHKFKNKVQCIVFSPNGWHFAVAMQNLVYVFKSPGELTGEYNPFVLQRQYLGGYDDVTWLDWSSDSRFLLIGCKNNTTKVVTVRRMKDFRPYTLGGHTDAIVACFFEAKSLDANTISSNGQLCLWECSKDLPHFESEPKCRKKKRRDDDGIEDGDQSDDDIKDDNNAEGNAANGTSENVTYINVEIQRTNENEDNKHQFFYKKLKRYYLANEARVGQSHCVLTAAHYNRQTKVLVVAFSTGSFYLYELPETNMIHSLKISDYPISAALFNSTGDWIALASRELGQLLVWEWQSEQYIMKQQSHSSEMSCISYSPDGQYIATGGEDSKVKLWNTSSGFCFVTFHEHTSGVTAVQFSRSKKFLISSSLDGTVRAYDIIRYRNFRTFTSESQMQFSCVAIDYSDELVVAGGHDMFDIHLWSLKMGTLLEIISGHVGPVCSLAFAPTPTSSTLVSGSWDKTIKIWDCLENKSENETIHLLSDVTCIAFNPNAKDVAVATLSCSICIFDVKTSAEIYSIDGRMDLDGGRLETDVVTAKKNQEGRYFSSLEYSADGECILAGGRSHVICIYNVKQGILLKKFEITQNRSFDGLNEYISRRHMSEFGNMALIEQRDETENGTVPLRLPGVQRGDMAARKYKPEVRVYSVKFCPTGQSFAAACTEGLCIYALDKGVVFDPFDLSLEVTPKSIKKAIKAKEFSKALIMALKLNETNFVILTLESIQSRDVPLICSNLPNEYAERLLPIISRLLQNSPHIEFYLKWANCLLLNYGIKDNVYKHASLLSIHEAFSSKYDQLNRICDFNKYSIKILMETYNKQRDLSKRQKNQNNNDDDDDDDDDDNDNDDDNSMLLMNINNHDFNNCETTMIEDDDNDEV